VSFHPAILLVAWGVFVMLLQPLSPVALAGAAVFVTLVSSLFAWRRTMALIRRTRWLLLSIFILFSFGTPGQRLAGAAGDLGLTHDGLLLATEHVLRLLVLLASLAVLHERLGTWGMMAGLYWLLGPVAKWRQLRERIVVRLMLVLDHVENAPVSNWREWLNRDIPGPANVDLSLGALRIIDWSALVLLGGVLLAVGASR
jgi:hypothetical protein